MAENGGPNKHHCHLLSVVRLHALSNLLVGKHALYSDAANPRYLGVFTLNPYHNATFLAARPFTIPAMLIFIRLTQSYRTDKKYLTGDYFLFSLFLLLSTLAKPSFTLIFVMMAGLYMLAMFFRSKCKDFKPFFGLDYFLLLLRGNPFN